MNGPWKAHAEYQFQSGRYALHIAQLSDRATYVAQPMELTLQRVEEGIMTTPCLLLPSELARVLFDALGSALNIYTPDARMAAEILAREQDRVDKFIEFGVRNGGFQPIRLDTK